ncbi:MAG: OmpA family protein [Chitinophagales bacterium]|nr:OmpA family protein [Chitinophagales bacterium]
MKLILQFFVLFLIVSTTSCVSNKKFTEVESQLEQCELEKNRLNNDLGICEVALKAKQDQVADLKSQIEDYKKMMSEQITQVGDLTVLSKEANENIKLTLAQMDKRDDYIRMLQAAKSKADSMNLALALNLKGVLKDGILDEDIEIMVDKTVVYVNLSDKMLFSSGSTKLTSKAQEVLGKIAKVLGPRKDIEIMVEGYTDDVPIATACVKDNWDLSVMRATSVVRVLKDKYGVNPDKLIASGRGEHNALGNNSTAEGRKMNRRTRIIILPKLNQFYDLLDPAKAPKSK